MDRKEDAKFFELVGTLGLVGCAIAYFTNVTWPMVLCFCLFMLLGGMIVESSATRGEADDKVGQCFIGIVMLLVCVCLGGLATWWTLLHYGVPALIGISIPLQQLKEETPVTPETETKTS